MGYAHPEDLQVFISMETPKHLPPKREVSDDAESGQVEVALPEFAPGC
jgi:hypothetical protein